ncbi:MAG TPA: hypothetical protein VFL34_20275, partial [Candidatus Sulfotelmatobacter sp.]|nr:hypothetical protein [Candidatus Sulfotelmatobacter sp.]
MVSPLQAAPPHARSPRQPSTRHELPQGGLCVRRDVTCDHMESLGEEQRGPARADDTGTDDGDAANGFNTAHVISPTRLSALISAPSDRPLWPAGAAGCRVFAGREARSR